VLATHPAIYYCGANWHPGEPAGGYCGIQHNSAKERRTIFSIWDTTDKLHPKITHADLKTIHNRFGGEGEGGHTRILWDWFLAEGDSKKLDAAYAKLKDKYGSPVFGEKGKKLDPIANVPLSDELKKQLASLPVAEKAKAK
jgi:hypothetical protein